MKIAKFKEELKEISLDQLNKKLNELRRELFTLRLNSLTSHINNYSEFKNLRRNIARILTAIEQKQPKRESVN